VCWVEMEITIIIVSYNTRDMTVECIRSVIEQTKKVQYELIVFDSASTDGSVEAIRSLFPQVKLIPSEENVGFASGNNIAAKLARGRYLLLLNPDTVVTDCAIERLHDFAVTNPTYRIWGGRCVFADGKLNQSCWRFQTLWTLFCDVFGLTAAVPSIFNGETYGNWQADSVRTVDIIAGCFFLIDRDLWQMLSGFDPIFFMYGEEQDLCLRARKMGARPRFTPGAVIIHYGGASYPDKAEQFAQTFAARITLMRRHWSRLSCLIGLRLFYIFPLARYLIFNALSIRGKTRFRQKAYLWGQIWRNRRQWIDGWTAAAVESARRPARPADAQATKA
jgi:N-acetylglucosaminyl-diphospho-decaprenol L-rhamnosyltransferase